MFNNPGGKIKGIAIAIFILLLLTYVIFGVILIFNGERIVENATAGVVLGILCIAVGFLVSWISALFLFSWGNMVEDVQSIREQLQRMVR